MGQMQGDLCLSCATETDERNLSATVCVEQLLLELIDDGCTPNKVQVFEERDPMSTRSFYLLATK